MNNLIQFCMRTEMAEENDHSNGIRTADYSVSLFEENASWDS